MRNGSIYSYFHDHIFLIKNGRSLNFSNSKLWSRILSITKLEITANIRPIYSSNNQLSRSWNEVWRNGQGFRNTTAAFLNSFRISVFGDHYFWHFSVLDVATIILTFKRQFPTNCLSVFNHFVKLALKGLNNINCWEKESKLETTNFIGYLKDHWYSLVTTSSFFRFYFFQNVHVVSAQNDLVVQWSLFCVFLFVCQSLFLSIKC